MAGAKDRTQWGEKLVRMNCEAGNYRAHVLQSLKGLQWFFRHTDRQVSHKIWGFYGGDSVECRLLGSSHPRSRHWSDKSVSYMAGVSADKTHAELQWNTCGIAQKDHPLQMSKRWVMYRNRASNQEWLCWQTPAKKLLKLVRKSGVDR
jgi:hypothetical protein